MLKFNLLLSVCFLWLVQSLSAQIMPKPPDVHGSSNHWKAVFNSDLSNAIFADSVWSYEQGILTASEDQAIWTKKSYGNFILDLEFKNEQGTNSGVIVYCTDMDNWIPNSVEIQIADDFSEKWSGMPKTWQCAAIFGHLAPDKSMVKKPGQWNHLIITCSGYRINVTLNDEPVTELDMRLWTSAQKNPDGSEIPSWLNRPLAEMATKGHIGFQGKHADASIFFRNIKIKELR